MNGQHLINCGWGIVTVDVALDHCHLQVMTPSLYEGDTHQPAESATCYMDYEAAQLLIAALKEIRPALKAVDSKGH